MTWAPPKGPVTTCPCGALLVVKDELMSELCINCDYPVGVEVGMNGMVTKHCSRCDGQLTHWPDDYGGMTTWHSSNPVTLISAPAGCMLVLRWEPA